MVGFGRHLNQIQSLPSALFYPMPLTRVVVKDNEIVSFYHERRNPLQIVRITDAAHSAESRRVTH